LKSGTGIKLERSEHLHGENRSIKNRSYKQKVLNGAEAVPEIRKEK